MKQRRSARATAQLLAINAKLYELERDRLISRYRFSINTLRRVSNRKAIRASFLTELEEELAELNWLLVSFGSEYAVVSLEKTDSWVKLGSKRLADADDSYLAMSDDDVDGAYSELFPEDDEAEPQDE